MSWNRYSYTLNNPLKYVDPDGRQEAPVTSPTAPKTRSPFGVLDRFMGNRTMLIDPSYMGKGPSAEGMENLTKIADALGTTVEAITELHEGQQGKHVRGHNNFDESLGRSELTHPDPATLIKRGAGTGEMVSDDQEAVDFNEPIGIYRKDGNEGVETTGG